MSSAFSALASMPSAPTSVENAIVRIARGEQFVRVRIDVEQRRAAGRAKLFVYAKLR